MALTLRRAADRGHANHGWLDSHHTFSFADYYDPKHMGFRALRVINDDRVDPAQGFPTHGHRDMEIVSYVLEGALEHKDSMGTGSIIKPGDVQRMSAGTGVRHSEYNASKTELVHFLQIWIQPDSAGIAPSYEQKTFSSEDKRNKLRVVASNDGRLGSVKIHANATLYATVLGAGEKVSYSPKAGRHTWIHVAKGRAKIGTEELAAGDGASTSEPEPIAIEGLAGDGDADVLVFDLA